MSRSIDRLLFVYNADSGPLNAMIDSAKKLLSINGCALCDLTHSLAGERSEWKSCKESLGLPVDYVHRNQLTGSPAERVAGELPCIVAQAGDEFVLLMGPEVIQRCKGSVADLKGRMKMHAAMRSLTLPA